MATTFFSESIVCIDKCRRILENVYGTLFLGIRAGGGARVTLAVRALGLQGSRIGCSGIDARCEMLVAGDSEADRRQRCERVPAVPKCEPELEAPPLPAAASWR